MMAVKLFFLLIKMSSWMFIASISDSIVRMSDRNSFFSTKESINCLECKRSWTLISTCIPVRDDLSNLLWTFIHLNSVNGMWTSYIMSKL